LAHLQTDFYLHFAWGLGVDGVPYDKVKQIVRDKAARDFDDKILFDDVREAVRADYEVLQRLLAD
jgi:hypothetical protein